ncbi:hydroxymethylglutaryl-CoA synthase [Pseudoclavibacter sp. RFBG4]|uniref:hydroxymethylglutaryl-CoA synthase n=1 Tax=Pseudoclavibacter sp. RFBG4 TaxID=2080575 RepID=UPI000CE899DC|nr:hydroxymethylglutaryl-CoA synthase [Pseudoclavibacter sp. RFBG4]PPG32439.1 hydroxymethylglutaryl-CoA synthase [Pseudoclavibacter sp. RFBG4]
MTTPIGIHDLAFATGSRVLDLSVIAERLGTELEKYTIGIGQERMSITAADEDVVTMGAAAAKQIIDRHGVEGIRTVLFATETGIDQSKAAGVYVHQLLGLPATCRVVELKQACYSATAALQFAAALVARDPRQRVLVIASDVARYELDSSGEPTQGAGAVAMLVASDPDLVVIEPGSGVFTSDIMDFWRPNGRVTALVDGKYSIRAYLQAVENAWSDYAAQGGFPISEFSRFCYHQPFTKMASKAHRHLIKTAGGDLDAGVLDAQIASTLKYNRIIGNTYTASIYLALLSLLDSDEELDGAKIGFLSYGSGSVAEFFAGTVQPGYRQHLRAEENRAVLEARVPIDAAEYLVWHERRDPSGLGEFTLPNETPGPFRLAGFTDLKREYTSTQ